MTPAELLPTSFSAYPSAGRGFAVAHLSLLRRLPLAVCPSFLQQIQNLDTSFPAERASLSWQCDQLQSLSEDQFNALVGPLASVSLPATLKARDWVNAPAAFVTELTAHLWSSGQLNAFRSATVALFAEIPKQEDTTHRLVFVVLGKGAPVDGGKALVRLRKQGVLLNALQFETAWQEIAIAMQQREDKAIPYSSWYVDGDTTLPKIAEAVPQAISVSYSGLAKLRERVLERMQGTISTGNSGAEQMRTQLTSTSRQDVDAAEVTSDPVLQRFYTELFTESSGPQIFSTSFVQWTGRELARRAQPHTLLLRYAPRRVYREMNEMFVDVQVPELDPQGSFRDAEMGAYYNWIEMSRVTAPGRLTFVAWIEDHPLAVIVGSNAPGGTASSTSMTLAQALEDFG